jgi:quercetin 2,3-dioxygenase
MERDGAQLLMYSITYRYVKHYSKSGQIKMTQVDLPTGSTDRATIRRGSQRGYTKTSWLEAWHCFNFGSSHEPGNSHFGQLIVFNDDIIQPGTGFPTHPHQDLEIVTWPVYGTVEHRDSTGNSGRLQHGQIQRMTAGSGLTHSEMNPSATEPSRWIQMWVVPDTPRLDPFYEDVDVSAVLAGGELVPIVGRRAAGALLDHHQRDAVLWAGWLQPGSSVEIPEAPFVHVYVASGAVTIEQLGDLEEGDAARIYGGDARRLTVTSDTQAEVLVWEMHSELSR